MGKKVNVAKIDATQNSKTSQKYQIKGINAFIKVFLQLYFLIRNLKKSRYHIMGNEQQMHFKTG